MRPQFEKGTELKFDVASGLNGTFKTTGVAALNLSLPNYNYAIPWGKIITKELL